MIYVRQVASGLPTTIPEIWLRPDVPLPNLFFLWEYVLGAVARVAGIDALVAASRSRWLMPVLGMPAFFLWARVATGSTAMARRVLAVILALVATQFINLSPDPLARLNEQRTLFSFVGTVHPSDFALEVLLPLLLAHAWLCLRQSTRPVTVVLGLLFFATFLIHPRELFQVAWYVALGGPVLLALGVPRRRVLTGWLAAMLTLGAVSGSLWVVTRSLPATRADQADELEFRSAALERLTESRTLYVEPMLRFQLHNTSATPLEPPSTHGPPCCCRRCGGPRRGWRGSVLTSWPSGG